MRDSNTDRRQFLRWGMAGMVAGIAGCIGNENQSTPTSNEESPTEQSPTDTETATTTEAETQTATETETAAGQTEITGTWPTFQFDAANTGHAPDESGPTRNQEILWKYETGSSVMASPVVADGTVYVGSRDNNLYAIDATTGEELWTKETGDTIRASAAVMDGIVYIGSKDANIYALDSEYVFTPSKSQDVVRVLLTPQFSVSPA